MRDLQKRLDLTYLFITHDLGVVRYLCDVVGVLYRGKLVEVADKASLFRSLRHPYTEALLAAAPHPEPGNAPTPSRPADPAPITGGRATGCPYSDRCIYRQDICARVAPDLRQVAPGHTVSCHFDLKLAGA
jgi:oligopeptide transport system ATP-binding protein